MLQYTANEVAQSLRKNFENPIADLTNKKMKHKDNINVKFGFA